MKKKITIVSVVLSGLLFGGCENDFDPKLYGELFPTNFPQTEKDFENYALQCYLPFGSQWQYMIGNGYKTHQIINYEGGVFRVFDSTTDQMAPWTMGYGEWVRLSSADYSQCVYYTRGSSSQDNVNHVPKWSQVTRFTEILGTLQDADPSIFTTGKQEQLIGDVMICRAMMMYFLMHLYGPVPLILDPDLVSDETAQKNLVRPTLDEMCQWIYDDFEGAIRNLPEAVSEKGRYNADYARFCLMKHCLNEGDHMDGWYERAMELYNELNNGKYSLNRSGENPFMSTFSYFNKWNSEIIMAQSNETDGTGADNSGNFFPLTMCFVPSDVSKIDNEGNKTVFWGIAGWNQFYNVAKEFYDSYEAGDLRRDAVVTEYWIKAADGTNPTSKKTEADLGVRWNGFVVYKWPLETDTPYQGQDFPLARWADVLLMMAELDVRISGGAPSQAAVEAVNEVRDRAGIDPLPASATASKEAFLDALLDERGHEFMYEGVRKIDLIRFNKYAQKTYSVKKLVPTHQYMPLPNYVVEQAASYGCTLEQTWSRPGWADDCAKATSEH